MKKKLNGIKKNDTFELNVADMTNTGAGVARIDGAVAFVDGAVDGDTVTARVIKVANGYLVCRADNIITPSPHRIESDCSAFKRCGGCVYRNIAYEHELELKRGYIEAAFKKQGLTVNVMPVINSGERDMWRNKAQIPVGADGVAGYYAKHSHEIIPCGDCRLHMDGFNDIADFVSDYIRRNSLSGVRHICMRGGEGGIIVCIVAEADNGGFMRLAEAVSARFGSVCGVLLNINPNDTNVIYGERFITLTGRDYIEDTMLGLRFRISMPSFYQVNRAAASLAYQKLYDLADVQKGDSLLDLYCGTGTIGLYFMSRGRAESLIGVEIVPEAVENAKINAFENKIADAEFICSDAALGDIARYNADIVIVDPPRKGLSAETVNAIAAASVKRIAYMSCDPDTLARDCAMLAKCGYTIGDVYPVDMFPRTGHVECVTALSKA